MRTTNGTKWKSGRSGTGNIEKVFAALDSLGVGWHSRTDLHRALGRQRLNYSDIGALQQLISAGRIEVREVAATHTDMIRRLEYRVTQAANNAQKASPSGKAKA
ncbi:MAG: hypothetical protein ACYDBJ_25575 [Aggregatilineales bacterium]